MSLVSKNWGAYNVSKCSILHQFILVCLDTTGACVRCRDCPNRRLYQGDRRFIDSSQSSNQVHIYLQVVH